MRLCFLCLFGLTKDEIHLLQWILWNRDYISRTVLDEIDAFTLIVKADGKSNLLQPSSLHSATSIGGPHRRSSFGMFLVVGLLSGTMPHRPCPR
jgi:hypothetical protein